MKASGAPKKIYFDGESKACKLPIFSSQNIEYTRTDAFIEKAATWIANRYQANGSYLCADDIEDFEKYIRGE